MSFTIAVLLAAVGTWTTARAAMSQILFADDERDSMLIGLGTLIGGIILGNL